MSGVHKLDRIRNEITRGATKAGEISKYGHVGGKRRRIRRQESDGDGGTGGKKERKTKAEEFG